MKPNQADFDKINRLILQPLTALYGSRLTEPMIEAFVEDLVSFDEMTLVKAMKAIRHECKRTPTLSIIIEKCRFFKPTPITLAYRGNYPWEENEKTKRSMVDEYMVAFSHSDVMREAKAMGYQVMLFEYVKNVAGLQASRIVGVQSGYDACIYNWDGRHVGEIVDQRIEELRSACDQQALSGVIEVTIPPEVIKHWKKTCTTNNSYHSIT